MAKKKKSAAKTASTAPNPQEPAGGKVWAKPGVAKDSTSHTAPGERQAFALGLVGTLLLVTFALPWSTSGNVVKRGYELIFNYSAFHQALRNNLDSVGGVGFAVAMLLTALAAIGSGFGWRKLWARFGDRLASTQATLALLGLSEGLLLFLSLLNMTARKHIVGAAYVAVAMLLALGLVALLQTMALDRAAGRTEGALDKSDWAVILGGLSAASLIHYAVVCYKIVLPAPEALISKLRTLR